MNSLINGMEKLQVSPLKVFSEKKCLNVHKDDIHALVDRGDHFYSGSKDCVVSRWDFEGKKIRDVSNDDSIDYTRWVTALSSCGKDSFAVGYRDGYIEFYDEKDALIKEIHLGGGSQGKHGYSKVNGHVCKDRNQDRIVCFSDYTDILGKKALFIGLPSSFKLLDFETGNILGSQKIHANDWVYCINPLPNDRLSIVLGSTLQIWKKKIEPLSWVLSTNLITEEESSSSGAQRPHISSVQPLDNAVRMALTDFQGAVKVVDIETGKLLRHFTEHKGRAWHVVEFQPGIIASGADDRCVKIWDSRKNGSVLTLNNHPGRVSQLLAKENTLIAASCPDNLRRAVNKAEFTIRDIRREK